MPFWHSLTWKRREKCLGRMPQAGKQLRFFQMTYDTARDIDFLHPHLRSCSIGQVLNRQPGSPSGQGLESVQMRTLKPPRQGLATVTWPAAGRAETPTLSQEQLGLWATLCPFFSLECSSQILAGLPHLHSAVLSGCLLMRPPSLPQILTIHLLLSFPHRLITIWHSVSFTYLCVCFWFFPT